MNFWKTLAALAALSWCVFGTHAQPQAQVPADKPVPKDAKPELDAKTEELTRKLAEYHRDLKSATANIEVTINVQMQGMKQEMVSEYDFAMQRPNRIAVELKSGMMGATLVSDGKELFTYMPMVKQYSSKTAPTNFNALSSSSGEAMMMQYVTGGGGLMFLYSLLHTDPYEAILKGVKTGTYAGEAQVNGDACHHLKFSQDEMDWEVWIDKAKPVARKLFVDLSKATQAAQQRGEMPESAAEMMKNMKMTSTVVFSKWTLNEPVPDERFKFTPPEGARKGDSLFGGGGGDDDEEHPLLGEAAPNFKLESLDGGEIELASHKGKDIVILDFWATWCGPCVRAMPVLAEVADAYKDKNVFLYMVNQREKVPVIKEFMEKRKFALRVLLDKDAAVGKLYHVSGIPQTVIIDKDGVVQAVHVGFSPDLKTRLSEELDALLAGKKLVAEGN